MEGNTLIYGNITLIWRLKISVKGWIPPLAEKILVKSVHVKMSGLSNLE